MINMIKNFETYINEDYFSKLANRLDTGDVRMENKISDGDREFIDTIIELFAKEVALGGGTYRNEYGEFIDWFNNGPGKTAPGFSKIDDRAAIDRYIDNNWDDGDNIYEIIDNRVDEILSDHDYQDYMDESVLREDYFSKLASRKDNGDVRIENTITEQDVMSIFDDKYTKPKSITIRKEGNKTVVDIDGSFVLREDTEEIPFQFGTVTGSFCCTYSDITSLEGCPKKVGGDFKCAGCKKLESLEGCPKEVGRDFYCYAGRKDFKKEDIMSLCKVKGGIFV